MKEFIPDYIQVKMVRPRYAITFGQVAIHHIGSTELGSKIDSGFTSSQLKQYSQNLLKNRIDAEWINLSAKLPQKFRQDNEASVLLIKGGANYIMQNQKGANNLFEEQQNLKYDQKYFDKRRGKTLNKRARYNIVFGQQEQNASQDYKKFTIKAFKNLKYLNKFRQRIKLVFGNKAQNLKAQGNKYYNEKSGIGFHGDSQRKIVICLSLGKNSVLRYRWRKPYSSINTFEAVDIKLQHGDIYIMSEKATGHDWRKRKLYRLVHAAGNIKYISK